MLFTVCISSASQSSYDIAKESCYEFEHLMVYSVYGSIARTSFQLGASRETGVAVDIALLVRRVTRVQAGVATDGRKLEAHEFSNANEPRWMDHEPTD
jgi:hypothetical protein